MSTLITQDNIRSEAYNFVKDGTPITERGDQWAEFTRQAIEEAKKQVENEEYVKIEKAERKLATKTGLTYEEWVTKAKKLYSIDPSTAKVTSIALGPTHGRTWECESQLGARKRVLKLMGYKRYDHFERGCDFAYDPDQQN
jgi:arginine utilization protein RocB